METNQHPMQEQPAQTITPEPQQPAFHAEPQPAQSDPSAPQPQPAQPAQSAAPEPRQLAFHADPLATQPGPVQPAQSAQSAASEPQQPVFHAEPSAPQPEPAQPSQSAAPEPQQPVFHAEPSAQQPTQRQQPPTQPSTPIVPQQPSEPVPESVPWYWPHGSELPAAEQAEVPDQTELLYDPAEAARIVGHLTDRFLDPEYILLFGNLAGGTPHSDGMVYDLLIVVRELPAYNWIETKRMLRYRMPYSQRKIACINPYILPLNYVEAHRTPFLYFAHKEGELLHCRDRFRFRRPRHRIDFAKAYADATFHFETFRMLGNALLEQAQEACAASGNVRLAAHFTAQAAVYFYHTLYYVYHGMEFDIHDPVVMHERMRTLATQLMLVFDGTHLEHVFTLPRLKQVLLKNTYSPEFYMAPQEAEKHMQNVQRAAEIIENHCELRLELYRELSEQ